MHEMSIISGMLEEVIKIAKENNAKKVVAVNLKIGKKSGITADSLRFAFDAVKSEHPLLSSAKIVIEEVPLIYKCNNCNGEFETDDIYFPSCPECKSHNLKLTSGEEQYIKNLELEVND